MSGKPNLPSDVESRPEIQGAAMVTPGLANALDHEREASMADEGGWAGAVMESEDGSHLREELDVELHWSSSGGGPRGLRRFMRGAWRVLRFGLGLGTAGAALLAGVVGYRIYRESRA
jgi:hypothetical protein